MYSKGEMERENAISRHSPFRPPTTGSGLVAKACNRIYLSDLSPLILKLMQWVMQLEGYHIGMLCRTCLRKNVMYFVYCF